MKKRRGDMYRSAVHTAALVTGLREEYDAPSKQHLEMVEEYGFRKWLDGKVDTGNLKEALKILANLPIDSGCKADIAENPDNDRCKIRQCCFQKGLDLCNECSEFPCDLLKSNPGVIKFHCIENLIEIKEKGIKHWIDRLLDAHLQSAL